MSLAATLFDWYESRLWLIFNDYTVAANCGASNQFLSSTSVAPNCTGTFFVANSSMGVVVPNAASVQGWEKATPLGSSGWNCRPGTRWSRPVGSPHYAPHYAPPLIPQIITSTGVEGQAEEAFDPDSRPPGADAPAPATPPYKVLPYRQENPYRVHGRQAGYSVSTFPLEQWEGREVTRTITANTIGITVDPPNLPSPPAEGTKEGKFRARRGSINLGWFLIRRGVNPVSEFRDLVTAFWRSIPPSGRRKCRREHWARQRQAWLDREMRQFERIGTRVVKGRDRDGKIREFKRPVSNVPSSAFTPMTVQDQAECFYRHLGPMRIERPKGGVPREVYGSIDGLTLGKELAREFVTDIAFAQVARGLLPLNQALGRLHGVQSGPSL